MKRIYLLAICLIAFSNSFASHLNSAQLRYEYTGNGNVYRVYLSVVKACANSVAFSATESVQFTSTCGSSFTRSFALTSTPVFPYYCPSVTTNCNGVMSSYTSYQTAYYVDTVTLNPCSSWKISYISASRSGATDNLINPAGNALYIEAFLNNANNINSSAYTPTAPLHLVPSGVTTTVAFQTIDVEGDSIAYEWYQPTSTNNTLVPYMFPYTVANPMDGTVSINATTQTLSIHPNSVGYYVLALKVKDYRNGVLVGTSVRDFTVFALGSNNQTNPLPAANSNFTYNTCPGNANSISLTFNDPTATDSVYLSVNTPNISGFTFNVSNSNGIGSASTTISWTTPISFNPATMPHFYFDVMARDNHCPVYGVSNFAVLVTTSQCVTDSVWSGDANGDFSVNIYDPLAIAVAYGNTGVTRPNATTNWQAEYCGNWSTSFMNGVNKKHADCNGDGLVDTADLNAIYANFGNWHLKPTPSAKVTNVPDLYFDLAGLVFTPGSTITIPIKLGTAALPMNNIYGIAGKISIGGITLASAPQLTFNPSWLGTSTNTLNFARTVLSDVDWVLARIDHLNTSGSGTVANLKISIPTDAMGKTMSLSFADTKIIDNLMQTITSFNAVDTTAFIPTVSVGTVFSDFESAVIFPNPTHANTYLHLITKEAIPLTIQVADVSGKMIQKINTQAIKGKNIITLPAQELSSGMYFVKIVSENASLNLKWVKE